MKSRNPCHNDLYVMSWSDSILKYHCVLTHYKMEGAWPQDHLRFCSRERERERERETCSCTMDKDSCDFTIGFKIFSNHMLSYLGHQVTSPCDIASL